MSFKKRMICVFAIIFSLFIQFTIHSSSKNYSYFFFSKDISYLLSVHAIHFFYVTASECFLMHCSIFATTHVLLLYSKWVLRHKYKHRERGDAKVDLLLSLKGDDKSSSRKKAAKIEGKRLMLLCEKKRVGKSFLPS